MFFGNTIFPQPLGHEKREGVCSSWECKFCASTAAQTVPGPGSQATEDSRVSMHTFSRKPGSWPQQNKLVGWRQAAFQQGRGVPGGEDGEKDRTVSRAIGPRNWLLSTHESHVGWGGGTYETSQKSNSESISIQLCEHFPFKDSSPLSSPEQSKEEFPLLITKF